MIRYFFFFLIFVRTPLLARVILIYITLLIRIILSIIASKWVSFLIILLFLGGMIVLFVYICTLITKIKVLIRNNRKVYVLSSLLLLYFSLMGYFKKVEFTLIFSGIDFSSIYQKSLLMLLVYRIIYLLVMLFISVKMVQKHKGGLKSKFNG